MSCSKNRLRVFIIHRWDMSDLQIFIHKCLTESSGFEVIDKSYPQSSPAPMSEFIQEYACGQMMDSDIVIVLPDAPANLYENSLGDGDYLSDLGHNFGRKRSIPHNSVYITELKTLMFDSCDRVPVLVLGWNRENAEYLAEKLRHPQGIEYRAYYDSQRFFTMGVDEIKGSDDLTKRIKNILDNYVR